MRLGDGRGRGEKNGGEVKFCALLREGRRDIRGRRGEAYLLFFSSTLTLRY